LEIVKILVSADPGCLDAFDGNGRSPLCTHNSIISLKN
jgi:hypothetical protein